MERTTQDLGALNSDRTWLDRWQENLWCNLDIVTRVMTTSRRGTASLLSAVDVDLHNVLSGAGGDMRTLVPLAPEFARAHLRQRRNAMRGNIKYGSDRLPLQTD